jgi:RNA-binding protein YhbY
MALTEAQTRTLRRAADDRLGVVRWIGTRGLAAASFERMAKRLAEKGLLRAYVWGGWEITDAGRAALDDAA